MTLAEHNREECEKVERDHAANGTLRAWLDRLAVAPVQCPK